MRPRLVHRILLAVLPALVIGAVVVAAIWGDNGLLRRDELAEELSTANQELSEIQRENQRLLRELHLLEEDPVAAERAVAEELGWSTEGTTLYRFDGGVGFDGGVDGGAVEGEAEGLRGGGPAGATRAVAGAGEAPGALSMP